MTASIATAAFSQRAIGAYLLRWRSRAATRARSASLTRSTLLSSSRSAKATCCSASLDGAVGLLVVEVLLDVLRVDQGDDAVEPRKRLDRVVDEEGLRDRTRSASPVVSMITWSTFFFRFAIASTRGSVPADLQQMQPLFISKISSSELNLPFTSASHTHLAKLVLDHRDFAAVVL